MTRLLSIWDSLCILTNSSFIWIRHPQPLVDSAPGHHLKLKTPAIALGFLLLWACHSRLVYRAHGLQVENVLLNGRNLERLSAATLIQKAR